MASGAPSKASGACCLKSTELDGKRVTIQGYDAKKRRWQVAEAGGTVKPVKAGSLVLEVAEPPGGTRVVVVAGLSSRPELNGRTARLLSYQALEGRFAVECEGSGRLLVKPDNLCDPASGAALEPPVEAAEGKDGQQLLRARRPFAAGEVLFEEAPALHREGVGQGIDLMADDVGRFLALDEALRARILALHHNDTISLKHAMAERAAAFQEHEVERSQLSGAELIQVIQHKRKGQAVPAASEAVAATFVLIWDANAFCSESGMGLYLLLSRLDHSCRPNALRVAHGDSFRLVALRAIAAGDEVTHSYLSSPMLIEPRAMRRQRLTSWFPSCWCPRCASEYDDTRCFPCASAGCGGVCVALSAREAIAPCGACASPLPNGATLLRAESQIVGKLLGFERDNGTITEKGVDTLVQLAQRMLAPRHWARAAIGELARDVLTQVYYWPPSETAAPEQRLGLQRAVALLQGWLACWQANFGLPSTPGVAKLERCGDLLTVLGHFPEAVEHYLQARAEGAALALPRDRGALAPGPMERVEAKLRAALRGQRNDEDLLWMRAAAA